MSIHHLHGAAVWLATLLLFALSGCHQADVPHAPSLERKVLMPVAFNGWQPNKTGRIQNIKERAQGGKTTAEETLHVSIEPIYVVKLDDSHAVMLTDAQVVDEQNQPMACHACPNYLGAYFFARDEQGWRLTSRQDVVANIGVSGTMGKTAIVAMGAQGYAFAAEWGSCWQGTCGSWLVLVGLRPDAATVLSDGLPMSADNSGAYDDCDKEPATPGAPGAPEDEPAHECFAVNGTWKAEGDLVKVSFQGEFRDLDDAGRHKTPRAVRSKATYAVREGKLVLQAGENPVPGF